VARNRKRRNDRRPRRPADDASRPGVATARASREREETPDPLEHTPEPLEHATPDVELAEAQLAVGRPELPDQAQELADGGAGGNGTDVDSGPDFGDEDDLGPGTSPVPAAATTPARWPGARLVHFLQGSWRELQRVQWPDRRQVMQATGVVIGFVIVAGAFLGLADFVAGKIVHFILQ
jgi:preprotein translocase subunit SecE